MLIPLTATTLRQTKTMQHYKALVRLAGNILHEVPKDNLTAPEIILLRFIHGDDAVVSIKKFSPSGKKNKVNQKQETERLKMKYGEQKFSQVFGGGYIDKLPMVLEGFTSELDDDKVDFSTSAKGGDAELKELQNKLLAD